MGARIRRGATAALVPVAAAVLLASCGSSPSAAGSTSTTATTATGGTTPGATESPTSAPTSYFTESLTGAKRTRSFTAPDRWRLTFDYDCSTLGHKGRFDLELHRSGRSALKVTAQEGLGGGGTHVYEAGSYYLSAETPCAWTVHATSP
ncbi:MAG: hypothetical protein ACRDZR_15195 [Acidimicrobiales bacterium]